MNNKLNCNIVLDLLPNYIEKLTSDETNEAIEEHLNRCADCKDVYEKMIADLGQTEKVPTIELKFLKKIKRTRLFAAVLSIVITLGLSYLLYASEYKYTNDKANLSAAITEYTSFSRNAVNAYVLETKEVNGRLIVTYKDVDRPNVNGVMTLGKGINGRYRIIRTNIKTAGHSAVVQVLQARIKGESVYVVSGYNLSDEIKQYGIMYSAYKNPGYYSEDRVQIPLKFDVENSQFLEIYTTVELDELAKRASDEKLINYHLWGSALLDEGGNDITSEFEIEVSDEVSCGIAVMEPGLLYAFIAIVWGIGYIMTRYFLID